MLNENIYHYRKKAGMSQTDLADLVSVSRQSVSKWETGESKPDIENLMLLAKVLNVSTDTLLNDTVPKHPSQPEWIDHLPKHISSLIRQHGWVYCAWQAVRSGTGVIMLTLTRVLWLRYLEGIPFSFADMFLPEDPGLKALQMPFNLMTLFLLAVTAFWLILVLILKQNHIKTEP